MAESAKPIHRLYNRILEIVKGNLWRSVKYSLSGFLGFLVLEALTFAGLLTIGSKYLILIDFYSFFFAILVEFFVNEHWTTRREGDHLGGKKGLAVRLLRFEVLNVIGNLITFSVEFALFSFFGLNPLIGNLIGSWIAFPVNYYMQMKNVWRIDPLGRQT